jgi:4-nitrophenyl phosphatase
LVLIFDLDGVVYLGDTAIPGAVQSLNHLAADGHPLFYITNNSTRSRRTYADKLTGLGIPTQPERVMTSAYATALYLQEQGAAGKRAYVVGEVGLREELSAIGMTVLAEDDASPAEYVVAGLDRGLTFAKLRTAHEQITRHGAAFIATNRDATYPMESGEIPGGGAIVAPIEVSTGVQGLTIGKPEPHTWLRILELAGAAPDEALMTGDRPETDILGAKKLGIHTVLTLTGVTTADEAAALPEDLRPEFVVRDLTELAGVVEGLARA